MFDSTRRLVCLEQQYLEMYGLSPKTVKPGRRSASCSKSARTAATSARHRPISRRHARRACSEGKTTSSGANVSRRPADLDASTGRWRAAAGWRPTRTSPSSAPPSRSAPRCSNRNSAAPCRRGDRVVPRAVESLLRAVSDSAERDARHRDRRCSAARARPRERAESAVKAFQRSLGQRRHRGGRRRRTVALDRRDQPPARARHRYRAHRGERGAATNEQIAGLARRRAEDRRRRQADPRHRRADQSAGAQRHHRGGARRRGRPRLRGGRLRGEVARGADREGDRGDRQPDLRRCRARPPARSTRSAASPAACRRSSTTPPRSPPRSAAERRDRRNLAERRSAPPTAPSWWSRARRRRRAPAADAREAAAIVLGIRKTSRAPRPNCAARSKSFLPRSRSSGSRTARDSQ